MRRLRSFFTPASNFRVISRHVSPLGVIYTTFDLGRLFARSDWGSSVALRVGSQVMARRAAHPAGARTEEDLGTAGVLGRDHPRVDRLIAPRLEPRVRGTRALRLRAGLVHLECERVEAP